MSWNEAEFVRTAAFMWFVVLPGLVLLVVVPAEMYDWWKRRHL